MHSTVRLAQTLSGFTFQELEQVLRVRGASTDTPHLTDLAIQLLKPESITRALRSLTNAELRGLISLSEGRRDEVAEDVTHTLRSLALTAGDAVAPEVTETLSHLIEAHGPLPELEVSSPPERAPAPDWAQRAFLESQQAVLTLRYAHDVPLKLTRGGTLAKASEKLLAEDTRARQDSLSAVIDALRALEALSPETDQLRPTPRGNIWSRLPHATRWVALIAGVITEMPTELRAALALSPHDLSHAQHTALKALYPLLDNATHARAIRFTEIAEQLSITSNGVFTPPAKTLIEGSLGALEQAIRLAEEAFPPVAPGVYLQPDLSIIAPGPIDPRIGLQLLDLTELTAPGLATSLTVSERSLRRALDRGWSTDEIRALLAEASLTPIPQPLEYLLQDLHERHGTITVGPLNTPDGATVVRVRDERVTRELLADSRLNMLGFTPAPDEPGALITKLGAEHVMMLLADARYPATRDEHSGERAVFGETTRSSLDEASALLTELYAAAQPADDPETTELAHRLTSSDHADRGLDIVPVLELAARMSQNLIVRVSDGTREHELQLLPISVAKGRLRALDERAGLERTVSIRAITSVEPLHN